jgi:hypothetical protein
MNTIAFVPRLSIAVLALGLVACGPGKSTASGSADDDTTSGNTESGEGSGTESGTEEDTGSFLEGTAEGTDTMTDPFPNGETCASDEECESGICYQTALGSVCSACRDGMMCRDEGDGINCTFNGTFFECSDGSAGEMCDDAESCMEGLFCSTVVDTGGLIPDKFCSECDTSADCTDPQICNPEFVPDPMAPTGENKCVDPGAIMLDAFCDHDGDGDIACDSGHCVIADIMGLIMLGVCGECDTEMDCAMGETCTPASIDVNTFMVTGSRCE